MQGGGSDGENPKAAAVREQLRKRLSEQEDKERATKTELVQKAASYLEQFYEVSQGAMFHVQLELVASVSQHAQQELLGRTELASRPYTGATPHSHGDIMAHLVAGALQRRNNSRAQREKDNREAESMLTVAGPKGDTEWERALDYVNFGFTRPNGSDLSRMKGLLFSAKAKNVPIKSSS